MGTLVPHYYQHEDQIPYMTYKIYRNDNIYYKIDPQTYFPALCPMALLPSTPNPTMYSSTTLNFSLTSDLIRLFQASLAWNKSIFFAWNTTLFSS